MWNGISDKVRISGRNRPAECCTNLLLAGQCRRMDVVDLIVGEHERFEFVEVRDGGWNLLQQDTWGITRSGVFASGSALRGFCAESCYGFPRRRKCVEVRLCAEEPAASESLVKTTSGALLSDLLTHLQVAGIDGEIPKRGLQSLKAPVGDHQRLEVGALLNLEALQCGRQHGERGQSRVGEFGVLESDLKRRPMTKTAVRIGLGLVPSEWSCSPFSPLPSLFQDDPDWSRRDN